MSMTLELVAQRVEVLEKQMAMLLADKNVDVSDDKPNKEKKAKKEKKTESDEMMRSQRRSALAVIFFILMLHGMKLRSAQCGWREAQEP